MEILMEPALLNYFVRNSELVSTCDFNTALSDNSTGIYEVLRIKDGKPVFLEEHIRRFFNSAKFEQFPLELTEKQIRNRIRALIENNKAKQGNIRFQLTMHPAKGAVFLAWIIPYFYPSTSDIENGAIIKTLRAARENPQSKRINLPVRQTAEKIIKKEGIAEVLMINDKGLVTECSRSNIFFIKNKNLFTPSLSLVLNGITRSMIISLAKENGIRTHEEDIRFDEAAYFDSCFLSSTSKNILPVRQIDKINYSVNNAVIKKLENLYDNLVNDYLDKFDW